MILYILTILPQGDTVGGTVGGLGDGIGGPVGVSCDRSHLNNEKSANLMDHRVSSAALVEEPAMRSLE